MIVKNISFVNNKVKIILDNKSFYISKENYIENPLAIESEVSEEKIGYLLEYELVIESKMELIKILNRKALSEYEVYLKLKDKNLKNDYIKQIIESLKRSGLINDEFVSLITVESMLVKRKGKKEIRKVLKEKRIKDDLIEKALNEIDEEQYLDNFNKIVCKYIKMYDKKSFKIKESMLRQKLDELGYEQELISKVNVQNDNEKELDLAISMLVKLIKNKKDDLNNYENMNKIKAKLAMKGFSYDIINLALEEVKNNEID